MEIIVVAILALVLLSPLDASYWAGTAKKKRTRSTARAHRTQRARRRSRQTASSHPFPLLSYATPRASAATRARWWWE